MIRHLLVLIVLTVCVVAAAAGAVAGPQAGVAGPWTGAISIQGIELRIDVTLTSSADGIKGTIDIPQQGARGLALTAVKVEARAVHFELPAGPGVAVFDGELKGDEIAGKFVQGPATGTFTLRRAAGAAAAPALAPLADAPYVTHEITLANGDVKLAGTLTTPKTSGPRPAIVFLTGSGAQNRDEEVAGFKVFGVLSDHLARQGYVTLRLDDRGVGGSTGSVATSTTEQFATDALAAVALLKQRPEVDPARIGLLGHSEGGLVAPLAASRSSDVAFIVLLAGPALPGEQIMLAQGEAIGRAQNAPPEVIAKGRAMQTRLFAAVRAGEAAMTALKTDLRIEGLAQVAALPEAQRKAIGDPAAYIDRTIDAQLSSVQSPWFRFFLDYDPVPALNKVRCPVLALWGELDLQVVPLEQNRATMTAALERAGNRDVTMHLVPRANHLFQEARTGSPSEYGSLPRSFAPGMLDALTSWLQARAPAR